jgi:hypothetical protein
MGLGRFGWRRSRLAAVARMVNFWSRRPVYDESAGKPPLHAGKKVIDQEEASRHRQGEVDHGRTAGGHRDGLATVMVWTPVSGGLPKLPAA